MIQEEQSLTSAEADTACSISPGAAMNANPAGKQLIRAEAGEEWKTWGRLSGNPDEAEFGEALDRGFRSAGWRGGLTEGIIVMQQQRKTSYASPCKIARLYADLGDKEQAFEWLETANTICCSES